MQLVVNPESLPAYYNFLSSIELEFLRLERLNFFVYLWRSKTVYEFETSLLELCLVVKSQLLIYVRVELEASFQQHQQWKAVSTNYMISKKMYINF